MTKSKKPGSGQKTSERSGIKATVVISLILVAMMVAVVARGGVEVPPKPPTEPAEPVPEDTVLEDGFVFPKDQPVPPSARSGSRVPV